MTTEEKLQHFYEVSMESAREESEKALEEYRAALSQMLAEHKEDKQKNAGGQLKLETENAKREINKALSAEQLHIKRRLSKKQQELREELFVEVKNKLEAFMSSPEYLVWLEEKIREALTIAGEDEVQIYLTPADTSLLETLAARCGTPLLVSQTPFMGGVRAVIPAKNILIDHTFKTLYESEKEEFNFDGGLIHE